MFLADKMTTKINREIVRHSDMTSLKFNNCELWLKPGQIVNQQIRQQYDYLPSFVWDSFNLTSLIKLAWCYETSFNEYDNESRMLTAGEDQNRFIADYLAATYPDINWDSFRIEEFLKNLNRHCDCGF